MKAFLKAGILSEDGLLRDNDTGTPQGSIPRRCSATSLSRSWTSTSPDREDLHRYLTTLEGRRELTIQDPSQPDLLPDSAPADLDPDERMDYDDGRLDCHTRLTVAATSTLRTVVHTGRRLTLLNRHAISARRGLILSGPAGTGKQPRSPSSARPPSGETPQKDTTRSEV
ncbi:hypothetical protein [Embleya scabrispora]|uniref:hypothetical protein n=1 Tax=Embleya scabrispora TaxID=159449 RepID=UPI0003A5A8AC